MSTKMDRMKPLGWKSETTYGTRVRSGTEEDTQTYKFFEWEPYKFPCEKPRSVLTGKFTSYDYNSYTAGRRLPEITIPYNFLEGQHLRRALGEAANPTGAGPFAHVLTGREPGDTGAPALPSITIHLETDGLTAERQFDLCGCVCEQLDLTSRRDMPGIYATEKFKYQRLTDDQAGYSLAGAVDASVAAVAYTNAPAPCLTNIDETAGYQWRLTEVKHGGGATNIIADVESINIRIVNTLIPVYTNRSGTNNYNITINKHPAAYYLKERRYLVTIEVRPSDNTFAFHDYVQQEDANTDLTIKWQRTGPTYANYIEWVWDTTTCPVTDWGALVSWSFDQEMLFPIVLEPKTLSSCTVSDGNNTNYSNW